MYFSNLKFSHYDVIMVYMYINLQYFKVDCTCICIHGAVYLQVRCGTAFIIY